MGLPFNFTICNYNLMDCFFTQHLYLNLPHHRDLLNNNNNNVCFILEEKHAFIGKIEDVNEDSANPCIEEPPIDAAHAHGDRATTSNDIASCIDAKPPR